MTTTSMDTIVIVGEQHFTVHRQVLIEHSGYFRRILQLQTTQSQPTTAVVSSTIVSPSIFAVLLDYMYSSSLRMDDANGHEHVAEVLRCAQLLDIPKVVHMCRHYIDNVIPVPAFTYPPPTSLNPVGLWPSMFYYRHVGQQFQCEKATHSSVIVHRPIASHRPLPFQQPNYSRPFVLPSNVTSNNQLPQPQISATSLPMNTSPKDPVETSSPETSGIKCTRPNSSSSSSASLPISVVDEEKLNEPHLERDNAMDETSTTSSSMPSISSSSSSALEKANIVSDVAYCDGPVKFQRILNENCDLVMVLHTTIVQNKTTNRIKKHEQHRKETVMTKDLESTQQTKTKHKNNDESKSDDDRLKKATFCVHCKHTFKSRYCYTKHKRRHLNPMMVDDSQTIPCVIPIQGINESHKENESLGGKPTQSPTPTPAPSPSPSAMPTPVTSQTDQIEKLNLEINSTFYPCKSCGSKFPSYYFLHKHQRICHTTTTKEQISPIESKTNQI